MFKKEKINDRGIISLLVWLAGVFIIIFLLLVRECEAVSKSEIKEIKDYAREVSGWFGIPEEITIAIIRVESDYRKEAVSYKGAVGLMQITKICYYDFIRRNPETYKRWITNFEVVKKDWKANILVGCWYLKRVCYMEKGNWKEAISAYNFGAFCKKTDFKNTRYLAKVELKRKEEEM